MPVERLHLATTFRTLNSRPALITTRSNNVWFGRDIMRAMLRQLCTLAFVLAVVSSSAAAQTVPACTPSTPTHQRQTMKTRPEPATLARSDIMTRTIMGIVKLAVPKGKILTDTVIDPHEDETVQVTGFVRLVKLSGDDCDLHIQLGAFPDKHVPQIIAEIPPGETATRKALAEILGVKIHAPDGKAIPFDGPKAVKIKVIGKLFDDSSHFAADHPKTGNNHGSGVATLWEVHPVWRVERVP
jgi:hypothetical protein